MPEAPPTDEAPTSAVLRRGLRLVRRQAAANPAAFTASVIGASAFAIGLVVSSYVIGRVTDQVIIPAFEDGTASRKDILTAGLTIVAVVSIRSLGVIARRYFGAMTGRRWQAETREDITDQFLEVPLAYHRRHPTGELLARADNDVEVAGEVMFPLPLSLSVIVLIVSATIALFIVDPVLMLIGLLLFPSLAVLNQVFSKRIEEPATEVQRRLAVVSGVAHESFDGALVVKALGREQAEVERLRASSEHLREARLGVGRLRSKFWPTLDLIPELGTILLVLIGSWRLSDGAITTGELVQSVTLFGMLAFPMRVLGFFFGQLPMSTVAGDRIDQVLAEPRGPVLDDAAGSVSFPVGPLGIEVRDVSFAYEDGPMPDGTDGDHGDAEVVLDGLSFSVAPGETVALVGSTGTGKSTICQLLLRLADPVEGQVLVGDVSLRSMTPDQIGERMAMVFQESFLFGTTVRENITLGDESLAEDSDRVLAATTMAQAHDFIGELKDGYETVVGERGVTLSGGQRQRVALARALARRPSVLVLDDATSAVDPHIESEILAGLRATDTTMVIVAHRLSTIELADRVLFLEAGRIAAAGSHRDLLSNPSYAALARAYEQDDQSSRRAMS